MAKTKLTRIQQKRNTEQGWANSTEILLEGEIGVVISNNGYKIKIGDGVTQAKNLPNIGNEAIPTPSNETFEII